MNDNNTPTIIIPQQSQQIYIYLLYEYGHANGPILLEAFTHRVQAEAAMRWFEEDAKLHNEPYQYAITGRLTAPHDNHC